MAESKIDPKLPAGQCLTFHLSGEPHSKMNIWAPFVLLAGRLAGRQTRRLKY